MSKKNVVIGTLGVIKDNKGRGEKRWQTWRPTISVVMQSDFTVDRFELIYEPSYLKLARKIAQDIAQVSPSTHVVLIEAAWQDPWDFADVYDGLYQFASHYNFNTDDEDYFLNITTGSHVNQICMFMLSEAQVIPSRLIQASPERGAANPAVGSINIIDLDLSKYAGLASRYTEQAQSAQAFLKAGIQTKSATFNQIIEEIEEVAINGDDPMLIEGPTGAGKTQLARRIYELKSSRGGVPGSFVSVNCATLIGDGAMSALFGHNKGAFTGAQQAREGYLYKANGGILFLDEIGELGIDEQAMLLHALEEKRFYPMGSDKAIYSDFQLIAGTNQNLRLASLEGKFREDLLARIDMWSWRLPSLKERIEDFEANLDFELTQHARLQDTHLRMDREAKSMYLKFAHSDAASWRANFRDLNASIKRMATLCKNGRISTQNVTTEINRLQKRWAIYEQPDKVENQQLLNKYLTESQLSDIDMFDKVQLLEVIRVCQSSANLAQAGRILFNASRQSKKTQNDSHRLRTYLAKFDLKFQDFSG